MINQPSRQTMEEYLRRLERAVASLQAEGMDAVLLCPGADLFYLSGFEHTHAGERLLAFFLRRDGSSTWITPLMNRSQVEECTLPGQQIRAWSDEETYLPALQEAAAGCGRLAFDDRARAAFLLDLLTVFPGVQVQKASMIMAPLRSRKTPQELLALRAAGRTVDETIAEAVALCQPGSTEAEVDAGLHAALLRRSPESSIGFSIIASGPNGALPHHETGNRRLAQGDVVVLDFGTNLYGYNSDITVVCAVGEPGDPEVHKVYGTVWEAQQKALAAIRPGVSCESVDRAARDHIAAAGYGDYFLHRTGHGLGLEIHEPPYIVAGNSTPLEEGMVFSIEPGIYLPGRFGVRLEVIVSVAANGANLINAPSAATIL